MKNVKRERGTYMFFNPNHENYKGATPEEIREWCWQDYERAEDMNKGKWHYVGVRAEADVSLVVSGHTSDGQPVAQTQEITSMGLWGIESDSGEDYFAQVERDELKDLRAQLEAMGFSKRAVTAAFRDVEREGV